MNKTIPATGLAILSGVSTALAYPKINLIFLAWFGLIPLLLILYRASSRQAFIHGTTAGFAFYAVLLYWIPAVPAHYGGLSSVFSFLIYALFSLFLGIFWGFFAWGFTILRRKYEWLAYLAVPFLWVSMEYMITHLFTGFPWGLLGNSQASNLYFLQLASITGVYGLSFTMMLFQGLVSLFLWKKKCSLLILPLVLVLFVHAGGFLSLLNQPDIPADFTGAVVQGNTPASTDFSTIEYNRFMELFSRYMTLSRNAAEQNADLIIWPELSVPLCFTCSFGIYPRLKDQIFEFVRETGCAMLLGTNESSATETNTEYYNTAVCVSPDLSLSFTHKTHLVPFGEYTPYTFIFGFLTNFTHAIGELTPGKELELHEFDGHAFGSPICYEIIFPDLVRKFTRRGAEFLVTITNDGWYGNSAAPYQHFDMAAIRAVENRRYLLRAATTGISGIISPAGRILARSRLNTPVFLTAPVSALSEHSLYVRYGDWLAILSLTITGLFLILTILFHRPEKR
jgi:apolipoprotein N-acyltransferase